MLVMLWKECVTKLTAAFALLLSVVALMAAGLIDTR